MSTRQEKLKELLKEEISDILRREFKDPRLGFITIIDTEISPDLRHAKIYVSVLGNEEERNRNMKVLKGAEHFIRQAFAKRVKMKVTPAIHFQLDTSVDQGIRIFELLDHIKHNEEDKSTEE